MHPIRAARLLLLPLVLAACATASTGDGTRPSGSRDAITAEEIRAAPQMNAFDLIQALRSRWLRIRGSGSMSRPEFVKVYRDGSYAGSPAALRRMSTREISEIRFLDGFAATQRFGTDHGNGAILVSTGG
ncbi:hypothetical protein BH23GEM4_BH23GEM4_15620 [soil metagenome]